MAQFPQEGRPVSFATTTPAKTITDLMGMDLEPGAEGHKHYANKRFPRIIIGNDASKLTVRTTDRSVLALFWRNREVAGITAIWAGTDTGIDVDGAVTSTDGDTYTCSVMTVESAVKISPATDGQPAVFEIVLIPCVKESDATEPTQSLAPTGA